MKNVFLSLVLLVTLGSTAISCTNQENTPAKAGTADTSGTGSAVGTGTPHQADSLGKGVQTDTMRH